MTALQALKIWRDPSPIPAPTCYVTVTVRLGDSGPAARCVEERLRQHGYWPVVDGHFDSTAVNALKVFEDRQGLRADGIADFYALTRLRIWGTAASPAPPSPCFTYATVSRLSQWSGNAVGDVATLKALSIWTEPVPQPDPWDLVRLTREAVGAANCDRLAATVRITCQWAQPPGGWLAYAQGLGNGNYLITIHPAMRTYPRDALLDLLAHEWAHIADWASPPTGGILGRITDEICAEAIADATASKLREHPVNAHPVLPICPAPDILRRVVDILDL